MNFFTATAFSLALLAAPGFAAAQSTPLPKSETRQVTEHNHDHEPSSSQKVPVTEGSFAEISGDHAVGATTAPISMIIYASVTCPHCASWFNTVWPDIKKNYVDKNKLRVVFREFPTAPGNIAVIGFQIANCAPQSQYFGMIEHQMKEQDNIFKSLEAGTGKATYLAIAKKAGLADETAMNKCIQSETGYERINKSMTLAASAKISSVPNFIINGQVHKGKSEYLELSRYLDGLIQSGYSPIIK